MKMLIRSCASQPDSSVRSWPQRRPHNVIYLAAAPDIWLLLRANREDLLEKVAKATHRPTGKRRRRDAGMVPIPPQFGADTPRTDTCIWPCISMYLARIPQVLAYYVIHT